MRPATTALHQTKRHFATVSDVIPMLSSQHVSPLLPDYASPDQMTSRLRSERPALATSLKSQPEKGARRQSSEIHCSSTVPDQPWKRYSYGIGYSVRPWLEVHQKHALRTCTRECDNEISPCEGLLRVLVSFESVATSQNFLRNLELPVLLNVMS